MSNDSFTEVSSRSWFGRIADSIKGIVFGFLLLLVGAVVLFWNEGRAVKMAQDLTEGKKACVTVKSDAVSPSNNGKLILFNAATSTSDKVADSLFGVAPKDSVLKLRREVQMYQWKEKKEEKKEKQLGGSEKTITTYSYSKVWSDVLNDSSKFKQSAGHENPSSIPFPGQTFTASPIMAGAFQLSEPLVAKIQQFETLAIPSGETTANLPDGVKPAGGGYYKGANPDSPQIGDAKISFAVAKPGPVTVLARQDNGQLTKYLGSNGNDLTDLRAGTLSAAELFQEKESENNMLTWILRLVGFLVITFGLAAILKPLSVVADFIPIFGDLVGAGTGLAAGLLGAAISVVVIGIGWLFYRPVMAIGLFVVAGGALFLLKRAGKSRKASSL